MERPRFDCYQCEGDVCYLSKERMPTCREAILCWKATTIRANDEIKRYARGCIFNERHSRLFCNNNMQIINSQYSAECCEDNLCNGGDFPILAAPDPNDPNATHTHMMLAIFGPIVIVCMIAIMICLCCRKIADFPEESEHEQVQHEMTKMRPSSRDRGSASTDRDSRSSTSGTISQANLLTHISLEEKWSTGSFGPHHPELWRGSRRGKQVTVKVYSLASEARWNYELQVYKMLSTKHDNVLEYVGSGLVTRMNIDDLWLVTRSINGLNAPLDKYLQEARLEKKAMLKACASLTRGLSYLHSEIIAHRNLGSNNVYVKHDGSCVIGNFECAATTSLEDQLSFDALFNEITAKRYVSPEYVSPHVEDQIWSLDRYQRADVYSLSLIFWEIGRMCIDIENVGNVQYAPPFFECLGNEGEPTIEEMRGIIFFQKERPAIPEEWHADQVMNKMTEILHGCWQMHASTRMVLLDILVELARLAEI